MPKCLNADPLCDEEVPGGGFCSKHRPQVPPRISYEQPSGGGWGGVADVTPKKVTNDGPNADRPAVTNDPRNIGRIVVPGGQFPGDKGGDKGGGGFRGGGGLGGGGFGGGGGPI